MSSESARRSHSPHRHSDYSYSSRHEQQAYPASRPSSSSNYHRRHNEEAARSPTTDRRRTHQGRDRDSYAVPAATAIRKSQTQHSAGSGSTLPTAYMGNSSSRLQMEESNSFADDISSLSSGGGRGLYHPHHHQGGMNNSSRRHLSSAGRARLAPTPQEVHYHGHSNGLPVISRNRLDVSANSHYSHTSHDTSSHSRHSHRPSLGGSTAASMRHIPETQQALGNSSRQLGARGQSMASLPVASSINDGDFMESVLPSLAPPPVPTMDSPGDVDAMAVFAKDQSQATERAMSRRKMSANEARKDRGKMLDNLRGALPMSNTSMRSLGTLSRRNMMAMSPTSQRGSILHSIAGKHRRRGTTRYYFASGHDARHGSSAVSQHSTGRTQATKEDEGCRTDANGYHENIFCHQVKRRSKRHLLLIITFITKAKA